MNLQVGSAGHPSLMALLRISLEASRLELNQTRIACGGLRRTPTHAQSMDLNIIVEGIV